MLMIPKSVVYEGLRIRAATAGPFPKVVPPEGDTIKGQFIPGGTMVAMNISSLLRSREIFGNEPELYRPERWLEADDEKRVNMEREVEMTFGSGRWMCAGKPIAFMELYKAFFEVSMRPDNTTSFAEEISVRGAPGQQLTSMV